MYIQHPPKYLVYQHPHILLIHLFFITTDQGKKITIIVIHNDVQILTVLLSCCECAQYSHCVFALKH